MYTIYLTDSNGNSMHWTVPDGGVNAAVDQVRFSCITDNIERVVGRTAQRTPKFCVQPAIDGITPQGAHE